MWGQIITWAAQYGDNSVYPVWVAEENLTHEASQVVGWRGERIHQSICQYGPESSPIPDWGHNWGCIYTEFFLLDIIGVDGWEGMPVGELMGSLNSTKSINSRLHGWR